MSNASRGTRVPYKRIERVPRDQQVEITSYEREWITVKSWEELLAHEEEILKRIARTRNGGNLFMANPFLLLADIGVRLSEEAKKEILRREPNLRAVSGTAYEALKRSKDEQKVRFHVHGLFARRAS